MNKTDMTPGIIFIGLGAFFLLRNLGFIDYWTMNHLIRLWPLILIVIGINTIFQKYPFVAFITWSLFFAIIILSGLFYNQATDLLHQFLR